MHNLAHSNSGNVIEIQGVTRAFGSKVALHNVTLSVPPGSVLGLVGENGAGKTTLIRHVLGLLKPQTGSVRVFGLDPVVEPVRVLSRIGYLSEEVDVPQWMRVYELMRYGRTFYQTWDQVYAEELRHTFDLDPDARIKDLSKGQRARAGLMLALAYRPELLVLDEPSSGLDPIVRRDILGAIIRTIADEGRTVLFSSHLLAEVESVSDSVAMISKGEILFCDALDGIKSSHSRVTFRFSVAQKTPPFLEKAFGWAGSGREWTAFWIGTSRALELAAGKLGAELVEQSFLSLDEIFIARAAAKDRLTVFSAQSSANQVAME